MLNKKAQVGLTITWGVAFLVIFFIMILFIGMSSLIGVKKIAPSWIGGGGGFDEAEVDSSEDSSSDSSLGDLRSQERLFYVLNSELKDGKKVRELILENRKEEIKTELNELLENSIQEECYFFSVDGDVLIGRGVFSVRFANKLSRVNLFDSNQKINVGLFTGEC